MKNIKSNYIQKIIELNATKQEKNLNNGDIELLGTNIYLNSNELMSPYIDKSIKINSIDGQDFKTLNINRLSTRIELDRLEKEVNHE